MIHIFYIHQTFFDITSWTFPCTSRYIFFLVNYSTLATTQFISPLGFFHHVGRLPVSSQFPENARSSTFIIIQSYKECNEFLLANSLDRSELIGDRRRASSADILMGFCTERWGPYINFSFETTSTSMCFALDILKVFVRV